MKKVPHTYATRYWKKNRLLQLFHDIQDCKIDDKNGIKATALLKMNKIW